MQNRSTLDELLDFLIKVQTKFIDSLK